MTPLELVAAAERMCAEGGASAFHYRPRAAALLARIALEQAADGLLETSEPPVFCSNSRSRFLCLTVAIDGDLAREAYALWARLSGACHQHAYQLAPTLSEVASWVAQTRSIVEQLTLAAHPRP